ncbi:MAG: hypothetical protein ACKVQR_20750, partial [Aquabacterium sp.]
MADGLKSRQPALQPRLSLRPAIAAGTLLIAFTFLGVGGWAAVAPISSAAVAIGKVSIEGDRKTVQHLEGGIVQKILVKDGDKVEAGQVVIRLD